MTVIKVACANMEVEAIGKHYMVFEGGSRKQGWDDTLMQACDGKRSESYIGSRINNALVEIKNFG